MAMVSPRVHREARAIRTALRELFDDAGGVFHSTYTELLIKTVGIFPPGTLVGLSTGETGIVTRRSSRRTRPVVYVLLRADGMRRSRPLRYDLSATDLEITSVYRLEDVPVFFSFREAWGYEPATA